MTTKSQLPEPAPDTAAKTTSENTRQQNMQSSKAQAALDKAAAETHPLKGDVDRAGFDLGGIDGQPTDAGLRDLDAEGKK